MGAEGSKQSAAPNATEIQEIMNTILNNIFTQVDLQDYQALTNPQICSKYIIIGANALDKYFSSIDLYPSKTKDGKFYYQKISKIGEAAADSEKKRESCKQLSFFYSQIIRTAIPLILSAGGIDILESNTTNLMPTEENRNDPLTGRVNKKQENPSAWRKFSGGSLTENEINIGKEIIITNLEGKKEYNGLIATIQSKVVNERVQVKILVSAMDNTYNDIILSIKPNNIDALPIIDSEKKAKIEEANQKLKALLPKLTKKGTAEAATAPAVTPTAATAPAVTPEAATTPTAATATATATAAPAVTPEAATAPAVTAAATAPAATVAAATAPAADFKLLNFLDENDLLDITTNNNNQQIFIKGTKFIVKDEISDSVITLYLESKKILFTLKTFLNNDKIVFIIEVNTIKLNDKYIDESSEEKISQEFTENTISLFPSFITNLAENISQDENTNQSTITDYKKLWDKKPKAHCVARALQLLDVAGIKDLETGEHYSNICNINFPYIVNDSLPTPDKSILSSDLINQLSSLFVDTFSDGSPLPKATDTAEFQDKLKRLKIAFTHVNDTVQENVKSLQEIIDKPAPFCKDSKSKIKIFEHFLKVRLSEKANKLLDQQKIHAAKVMKILFKLFDEEKLRKKPRKFALNKTLFSKGMEGLNKITDEARNEILENLSTCEETYNEGLAEIMKSPEDAFTIE